MNVARKKSENWLRGRKRLGKMVEWQRREVRLKQCLAWKVHIPGLLDPNVPVQPMAKAVLAEGLDPEKRSERQLMRVIVDVRSHYGDISCVPENMFRKPPSEKEFDQLVTDSRTHYREILCLLDSINPDALPADVLIDVVHALDKVGLLATRTRRKSEAL